MMIFQSDGIVLHGSPTPDGDRRARGAAAKRHRGRRD
jgi:hypothetical protein